MVGGGPSHNFQKIFDIVICFFVILFLKIRLGRGLRPVGL